jgi:transcriptional regulator with XRE-family HTH domain
MNLRELRHERMITQREVAERAGITVTTLSRIENGKVIPTFKTIRNLAEVFGISPQEMREIVASAQLPLWAVAPPRWGGEGGERREQ